MATYILNVYVR